MLRLVSQMCGSRFGRGVVVPGGVTGRTRTVDLRGDRSRGSTGRRHRDHLRRRAR